LRRRETLGDAGDREFEARPAAEPVGVLKAPSAVGSLTVRGLFVSTLHAAPAPTPRDADPRSDPAGRKEALLASVTAKVSRPDCTIAERATGCNRSPAAAILSL